MAKINFRPAEHEVAELIACIKRNPNYADLKSYEITYDFISYDKAFATVRGFQHRFEMKGGRWECTRGPWD